MKQCATFLHVELNGMSGAGAVRAVRAVRAVSAVGRWGGEGGEAARSAGSSRGLRARLARGRTRTCEMAMLYATDLVRLAIADVTLGFRVIRDERTKSRHIVPERNIETARRTIHDNECKLSGAII